MNDDTFLEKMADILQMDKSEVDSNLILDNGLIDSMALIEVMALIDEVYGVSVSGQEINECSSAGELISLIQSKINPNNA